ncbi:MAG: RidA family protein [Isosphaeraceae bacterium]|nr:RidA family protein [Isosphaeraceae bacterium]
MFDRAIAASIVALALAAGSPCGAAEGVREVGPNTETQTSSANVVPGSLHLVHTAQLLPLDAGGAVLAPGRPEAQVEAVLGQLDMVLREARSGADRLVKVNVYVARQDVVPVFRGVFARWMAGKARPAIGFVVGALADPRALVCVDAVAVTGEPPRIGPVSRQTLTALGGRRTGAHVATLPAGGRVYVSGQAEAGSDIAQATRKTLAGLLSTLNHLGLGKSQVVQVKSFLQPIGAVDAVERELAEFFGAGAVPPLVFVEWRMSAPIEIELIASSGRQDGGEAVEYLTPPQLKASPVFSRVVRINRGDTIFVSGLYGPSDSNGGQQVESIFKTLQAVLAEAGGDFRHLVKATYYVTDEDASRALNELRPRFYDPSRPPAASKATVAGVGEEGRSVTLDMIAIPRPGGR